MTMPGLTSFGKTIYPRGCCAETIANTVDGDAFCIVNGRPVSPLLTGMVSLSVFGLRQSLDYQRV